VLDPGLFYALRVGALLELVCVDTSWGAEVGVHDFEDERAGRWLDQVLPPRRAADPDAVWRIPFCHHPAYCAGPHHENMDAQIDAVVPRYRRAGVRLVLSGHEHNFQHGLVDGIHHVVSGAAGKLQEDPPTRWDDAGTVGWASVPHCLLVEVARDHLAVTPFGLVEEGDQPRPLTVRDRDGRPVDARIVIRREAST
jgi:3',5'-cyclic AMP phosphodiesterase CpdA